MRRVQLHEREDGDADQDDQGRDRLHQITEDRACS